jgi:hypothetical protein
MLQVKGALLNHPNLLKKMIYLFIKKGRQQLEVRVSPLPLKNSKHLFSLTTYLTIYAIKQENVGD